MIPNALVHGILYSHFLPGTEAELCMMNLGLFQIPIAASIRPPVSRSANGMASENINAGSIRISGELDIKEDFDRRFRPWPR